MRATGDGRAFPRHGRCWAILCNRGCEPTATGTSVERSEDEGNKIRPAARWLAVCTRSGRDATEAELLSRHFATGAGDTGAHPRRLAAGVAGVEPGEGAVCDGWISVQRGAGVGRVDVAGGAECASGVGTGANNDGTGRRNHRAP